MTFSNFERARTHTFPSGNERTSSGSKFDTTLIVFYHASIRFGIFNLIIMQRLFDAKVSLKILVTKTATAAFFILVVSLDPKVAEDGPRTEPQFSY